MGAEVTQGGHLLDQARQDTDPGFAGDLQALGPAVSAHLPIPHPLCAGGREQLIHTFSETSCAHGHRAHPCLRILTALRRSAGPPVAEIASGATTRRLHVRRGPPQATAKALGVHRNTVLYRLKRATELTGLNAAGSRRPVPGPAPAARPSRGQQDHHRLAVRSAQRTLHHQRQLGVTVDQAGDATPPLEAQPATRLGQPARAPRPGLRHPSPWRSSVNSTGRPWRT
jgi:hypothetical protein